jgi:hypothetical protein
MLASIFGNGHESFESLDKGSKHQMFHAVAQLATLAPGASDQNGRP